LLVRLFQMSRVSILPYILNVGSDKHFKSSDIFPRTTLGKCTCSADFLLFQKDLFSSL
jgi:hypothetical protein